jgi:hypothetical protein
MAITYAQALELARQAAEPEWNLGTFCLDDREITEDDEVYVFTVGARELLVDGDEEYVTWGGAMPVVSKVDGTVEWQPWVVLMNSRPDLRSYPNPNPTLRT